MISTPEAEAGAQGRCSGFKQRVWGGHSCLCRDSWSLLPALGRYSRTGLAGWRGQSGDSCLQPGEQDVTGSELGSRPVTPGHLGSGDCAFARGEAGSWPFLGVKAEVLLSYNSSKNYCFENDKSQAKNRVRRAGSRLCVTATPGDQSVVPPVGNPSGLASRGRDAHPAVGRAGRGTGSQS